ncbi:hypothetical protein D3C78_1325600 [compost metagenome]
MTRDDGWRFLMIGRRIERLQFLAESIADFVAGPAAQDQSALAWLLELGNSSITYRTRYLAAPQLIPVLDLLVLDAQNPHAVLFQLRSLQRSLASLGERFELSEEGTGLQTLSTRLAGFDLGPLEFNPLASAGSTAVLAVLAAQLLEVAAAAAQLSDHLGLRFFVHVDASQQTQSL